MTTHLRALNPLAKVGVLALLLLLAGGYVTSGLLLYFHYEKRDERPGLTIDDIIGAYHGLQSTAPILAAVERGHPENLPPEARAAFVAWLTGPRVTEDYDNLDLGDNAPVELLAAHCVSCHKRGSPDSVAAKLPLEFFDDVKKLAVSRKVEPTDLKIVTASTHAHAIALATIGLVLAALLALSSWPRGLSGAVIALIGVGICLDIACWWITRLTPLGAYGIVAGGMVHNAGTAAALLLLVIDLCRPPKP